MSSTTAPIKLIVNDRFAIEVGDGFRPDTLKQLLDGLKLTQRSAPTTKFYMWIFRGGDIEKPALIYQYHATRSGG